MVFITRSYCILHIFLASLETARKKAEDPDFASNSEVERGKGMRKKIPISKESSSESEELTPPPTPKNVRKFMRTENVLANKDINTDLVDHQVIVDLSNNTF